MNYQMKRPLFFTALLLFLLGNVKAQTLKTDVLVIGNGNTAVAAGIQSALSGVKTVLLLEAGGFDIAPIHADVNSGLQEVFSTKYKKSLRLPDSTQVLPFDKQHADRVLNMWTDSIKGLTVIKNVMWTKADRSGNNWNFKLSDGRTLKPKILINPANAKLNDALKITPAVSTWTKLDHNNTIYRTSVAAGKSVDGHTGTIFSLYQFFIPDQENLVWVSDAGSMLLGQAAGATAAYSAFYDTKTSLSNLKRIQGELILYKLNLIPFADIKKADTNWKAIQFVGVTGVIKAEIDGEKALFAPDKLVSTAEITQPIKDFYYKAQLWFDDYKNPQMTIASTIDLVCYVGNKSSESTKKELEKKWKTTYQFKANFELNRQITRREFAVILQDYMPPFNVNVDKTGKVLR